MINVELIYYENVIDKKKLLFHDRDMSVKKKYQPKEIKVLIYQNFLAFQDFLFYFFFSPL